MPCLFPAHLQQPPAPESPDALRQRLAVLYRAQKWNELADAFEALTPAQRGPFLDDWIDILERAKRWERLVQVSDAVLGQLDAAKHGKRVEAFEKRKLSGLTKLNRWPEALALCEMLGDRGDPFFFVLGTDQARLAHDYPSMERLALKWAAKQPQDPHLPGVLGEALARQDRFVEAEPHLRKAVAAQPRDADAWSNLGRCLNDRKAWAEAEAALAKALEADPKHLEARYNRGRSLFELQRYGDAVEDFQLALVALPDDAILKENLRQAERYLAAETKGKKARPAR
jgi:tetratricopeptide (TPR) repeat protein